MPRELRYDNFNIHTCGTEPDRHLRRICRFVWDVLGKTARWLDITLSGDHGIDERDRFLLSVPSPSASHILGILSLIALAIAVYARYSRGLAGGWRRTYAITAAIALYLNVFVLIAQAFQKVPALKVLAPTQSEPPFLVTQLIVLVIFLGLSFSR